MTNRLSIVIWMLALSAVFSFAESTPAAENKPVSSASEQFVQKLGDSALSSLTDKIISSSTREERVRNLLEQNFDIQAIGKFAMGPYWREASDTQRQEYLGLFEGMIVRTYTKRFEDYSGQTLKVMGSTAAGASDDIVLSQVIQKDGPSVNLEWRVRNEDGGLKIVDVIVEGISMSVTQRSDFSSVIQNSGGSVDALLKALRQQTQIAQK